MADDARNVHSAPRKMPVGDIASRLIPHSLAALIWTTIPESARRVKQRISSVMDWIHRQGASRNHQSAGCERQKVLPRQSKATGHFARRSWQIPCFMRRLERLTRMGAGVALRDLDGCVVGRGTRRDMGSSTYRRSVVDAAERMKAGRAHVVPLSDAAIAAFQCRSRPQMIGVLVLAFWRTA